MFKYFFILILIGLFFYILVGLFYKARNVCKKCKKGTLYLFKTEVLSKIRKETYRCIKCKNETLKIKRK